MHDAEIWVGLDVGHFQRATAQSGEPAESKCFHCARLIAPHAQLTTYTCLEDVRVIGELEKKMKFMVFV